MPAGKKSAEKKKSAGKKSTGKKNSTGKPAAQAGRKTAASRRGASPGTGSHASGRKWSAGVKTVSTYPEEGLFKQDAETIARRLASKKVSPKGPASGMRMLSFYINRAGKNLSATRRRELDRAKALLHERVERARGRDT